MTAAFYGPIVSVLTDMSLNDSVIFGYTLQTAHAVFLPFPAISMVDVVMLYFAVMKLSTDALCLLFPMPASPIQVNRIDN